MADELKSLQIDYYGRVVDISSEDLIKGMTAPMTHVDTAAGPAANLAAKVSEGSARKNKRDEATAPLHQHFNNETDTAEIMQWLEMIHTSIEESNGKKGTYKQNKKEETPTTPAAMDLDSSLEKAFKKSDDRSPWSDDGMVNKFEKLIDEGLGHSIGVHDYTSASILIVISKDIKHLGMIMRGLHDLVSGTRDNPLNTAEQNYVGSFMDAIPSPEPEHATTGRGGRTGGGGGGGGRRAETLEESVGLPPAPIPTVPMPAEGRTSPDYERRTSPDFERRNSPDYDIRDVEEGRGADVPGYGPAARGMPTDPSGLLEDIRATFKDFTQVLKSKKGEIPLTPTDIDKAIEAIQKDIDNNKLTSDDVRNMTLALQNINKFSKENRRYVTDSYKRLVEMIRRGATPEQVSHGVGRVSEASNYAVPELDKWLTRFQSKVDALDKVLSKLSLLNPAKLGVAPEMAYATPAKTITEAGKEGTDWIMKIHAAAYESMGMSGSAISDKPHPSSFVPGDKRGEADAKAAHELQKTYYEMGTERDDLFLKTGQLADVVRKQYLKNLHRGITEFTTLNRVTKQGLSLGTLIGANAEQTADEFAEWSQSMGLTNDQTAKLARNTQMVGRLTGVTGDNLLQAVKSSRQFAENMRNAGTFTDRAAKGFIAMSASGKKFGVEKELDAINKALSNSNDLLDDPGMMAFLGQSAAMSGLPRDQMQKLMGSLRTGQVPNNPEQRKALTAGQRNLKNSLLGSRFGEEVSAKELGERAAAGDEGAAHLLMAANKQIQTLSQGKISGIGVLERSIEAQEDAQKTTGDRIKDLETRLEKGVAPADRTRIIPTDERKTLEGQLANLKKQKTLDAATEMQNRLSDVSIKTSGEKPMSFPKALEGIGGQAGLRENLGQYKDMLSQIRKEITPPERKDENEETWLKILGVAQKRDEGLKKAVEDIEKFLAEGGDIGGQGYADLMKSVRDSAGEMAGLATKTQGLDPFTNVQNRILAENEASKKWLEKLYIKTANFMGEDKFFSVSYATAMTTGIKEVIMWIAGIAGALGGLKILLPGGLAGLKNLLSGEPAPGVPGGPGAAAGGVSRRMMLARAGAGLGAAAWMGYRAKQGYDEFDAAGEGGYGARMGALTGDTKEGISGATLLHGAGTGAALGFAVGGPWGAAIGAAVGVITAAGAKFVDSQTGMSAAIRRTIEIQDAWNKLLSEQTAKKLEKADQLAKEGNVPALDQEVKLADADVAGLEASIKSAVKKQEIPFPEKSSILTLPAEMRDKAGMLGKVTPEEQQVLDDHAAGIREEKQYRERLALAKVVQKSAREALVIARQNRAAKMRDATAEDIEDMSKADWATQQLAAGSTRNYNVLQDMAAPKKTTETASEYSVRARYGLTKEHLGDVNPAKVLSDNRYKKLDQMLYGSFGDPKKIEAARQFAINENLDPNIVNAFFSRFSQKAPAMAKPVKTATTFKMDEPTTLDDFQTKLFEAKPGDALRESLNTEKGLKDTLEQKIRAALPPDIDKKTADILVESAKTTKFGNAGARKSAAGAYQERYSTLSTKDQGNLDKAIKDFNTRFDATYPDVDKKYKQIELILKDQLDKVPELKDQIMSDGTPVPRAIASDIIERIRKSGRFGDDDIKDTITEVIDGYKKLLGTDTFKLPVLPPVPGGPPSIPPLPAPAPTTPGGPPRISPLPAPTLPAPTPPGSRGAAPPVPTTGTTTPVTAALNIKDVNIANAIIAMATITKADVQTLALPSDDEEDAFYKAGLEEGSIFVHDLSLEKLLKSLYLSTEPNNVTDTEKYLKNIPPLKKTEKDYKTILSVALWLKDIYNLLKMMTLPAAPVNAAAPAATRTDIREPEKAVAPSAIKTKEVPEIPKIEPKQPPFIGEKGPAVPYIEPKQPPFIGEKGPAVPYVEPKFSGTKSRNLPEEPVRFPTFKDLAEEGKQPKFEGSKVTPSKPVEPKQPLFIGEKGPAVPYVEPKFSGTKSRNLPEEPIRFPTLKDLVEEGKQAAALEKAKRDRMDFMVADPALEKAKREKEEANKLPKIETIEPPVTPKPEDTTEPKVYSPRPAMVGAVGSATGVTAILIDNIAAFLQERKLKEQMHTTPLPTEDNDDEEEFYKAGLTEGSIFVHDEELLNLLRNPPFLPADAGNAVPTSKLVETLVGLFQAKNPAVSVIDDTPKAKPSTIGGLDEFAKNKYLQELADVDIAEPLHNAVHHLDNIEMHSRKTSENTEQIRKDIRYLVGMLTQTGSSSNNTHADTSSITSASSPPNYWSWALDMTTGPNLGARRPSGTT